MGKAFNTFLAISTGGLSIPISKALSGSGGSGGSSAPAAAPSPSPAPMPEPPKPEEAAEKAQDMAKKRKLATTQTVYASPLGVAGQANVARAALKNKLGE